MTNTYDRIARFYDVDMARNMPFDDIGFYAGLCAERGGRVLELGCGNGRILLELLRRGIDVVGVDASGGMLDELQRKAAAQSLPAPAIRCDVRDLALDPGFATVLCPYSLITYMVADGDAVRMLAGVRRLLGSGGVCIVDAFVPRPLLAQDEFTADYARPYGQFTLARSKRVRALDAGTNRVERRYLLVAADGSVVEQVDVAETIRPFAPDAVRQAVAAAGLVPDQEWWNYGVRVAPEQAQFFTLAALAG